ncbi:MAG: serine/threonine-protein kinase [Gemmatimonadaceae bacterium]
MEERLVSPGEMAGKRLADRYDVLKQLGVGGSAYVFLAIDRRYQREVAVKVLRGEIASAIGTERFLREIETLARLQHPSILPLYDSGTVDGVPFFVMPYVSGQSLRSRLQQETFLPVEDALRIIREVSEALDYAHGHGIVHRDIKPENVLLHSEHAVLADFGIARAIDVAAGQQLTDSQFAVGTPAYMSPEQTVARGHVDPNSDVYSLGILAYEMLAGCLPFTGPTPMAIQARKVLDKVPSLRTIRPSLDPAIETAITRALSVVPADRFVSAGAFARALSAKAVKPARFTMRRMAIPAAGVTIVAVAGVLAWTRINPEPIPHRLPRVLVSEFINVSRDSSLDYLGITAVDWLTQGLQRTGVISVVGTESAIRASRFAREHENGQSVDPILNLANETGADIVVSGRFYRQRDSLQYQIQVTDTKARRLIGAIGPIATPLNDPIGGLAVAGGRLMGLLAARVDDRLDQFVSGVPDPPTYEAYRQFSHGLDRYIGNDFAGAARLFTSAFSQDTTFAAPLLFASISLSNQGRYREADSLLDRLAEQRDRLTPFHQTWLDYRRALMAGQRRAALNAVRALDSADPGSKATYNHGTEALENGYVEEALVTLRKLSPNRGAMRGWVPYFEVLGTAYHLVNRFSDELAIGDEARRQYPDRLYAFLPSIRALAALSRVGRLEELLNVASDLPADRYGTSYAALLVEAGDETRVHGEISVARAFYLRAIRQLGPLTSRSKTGDLVLRSRVERALRRWKEAEATARALTQIDSTEPEYQGLLGAALAHLGRTSEARAISANLINDRRPYHLGASPRAQARIATALGETDAAITYLTRSFAQGQEYDLWVNRDPDFDALRTIPRFEALVALKH